MTAATDTAARKPRIAIMGEFSAGKSTLCNLLIRSRALPEKVTATRLAPVWMTYGDGNHMRVRLDGVEEPVALETLHTIPVEDTFYIRLGFEEDMLEHCDIIDCPGISDPNMDPDVWGRILTEADAVIWLTHATQAWRQSEAAVWETVAPEVQAKSILLLTRWDKVTTEHDRGRVYTRVAKETAGKFAKIFPVALTDALAASDDYEAWQASGAGDMMEHLATLIADLNAAPATPGRTPAQPSMVNAPQQPSASSDAIAVKSIGPAAPAPAEPSGPRIIPRRVKPSGMPRRERPAAGFRL